jgi:hypothetical protein
VPSDSTVGELPNTVIPEDVRRFILTAIPSIPYLEAMLLFYRSPDVDRSGSEVAQWLYLSDRRALELLEGLREAGVLMLDTAGTSRYRYAPRDETLARAIEGLSEVYAADIVGVTRLVHDTTGKRAQLFADAFRIRKDR